MPKVQRVTGVPGKLGESARPPQAPITAAPRVAPELLDLDTQLMLAFRQGDRDAANSLVRRNFDRVTGFIGRMIRDPKAVEDLTQDVFLRVLTRAPEFEPRAKFTTWLYRIATNRALNYLRDRQVQARGLIRTAVDFASDEFESEPARTLNIEELRERISTTIGTLPANQRVALTLFEFEGLSYEQIATVMDLTVESVRSLLTRARSALRKELGSLV